MLVHQLQRHREGLPTNYTPRLLTLFQHPDATVLAFNGPDLPHSRRSGHHGHQQHGLYVEAILSRIPESQVVLPWANLHNNGHRLKSSAA